MNLLVILLKTHRVLFIHAAISVGEMEIGIALSSSLVATIASVSRPTPAIPVGQFPIAAPEGRISTVAPWVEALSPPLSSKLLQLPRGPFLCHCPLGLVILSRLFRRICCPNGSFLFCCPRGLVISSPVYGRETFSCRLCRRTGPHGRRDMLAVPLLHSCGCLMLFTTNT